MPSERSFVPAAGHDWLLPFYDTLSRLAGSGAAMGPLIEQAGLRPGQRVLDLGCGTGNLTLRAKRAEPGAEVTGVDPDPKALALAARKAGKAGLGVRFEHGFGDALPYPAGSFDRVLSSFMFHHLDLDGKRATLAEVKRVLAPGGSLHLLDFAPRAEAQPSRLARLLHRSHTLADNRDDRIPQLMQAAGLAGAAEVGHRGSPFGNLGYFRATGGA